MIDARLKKIEELIKIKKINEAQLELSKLGEEFNKNSDYLYLRGKIFYLNKLYYLAIETISALLVHAKQQNAYESRSAPSLMGYNLVSRDRELFPNLGLLSVHLNTFSL